MTQAERNKEIVRACYEQFFVHRRLDVVAEFIHEKFVQHSPDAPSGRDAFLAYLRESTLVGGRSDIKRILADGDHVAVHHHLTHGDDDGPGLAVVSLWRLEEGKLAEHWNVEQPMPDAAKVPNGMF